MSVTVQFLGRLRDVAGSRSAATDPGQSVSAYIAAQPLGLAQALAAPGIAVALNKQVLARGADPVLEAGDELAFMPPFSGG
jgi:molybdopterin converting factor small subunit